MTSGRDRPRDRSDGRTRPNGAATLSFELHPRPPYRLDLTAWALRRRGRNDVDRWNGTYQRALQIDDHAVAVRVQQIGTRARPTLRVDVGPGARSGDLDSIRAQLVRLLGVNVDLGGFYDLANGDPRTSAVRDRFLGLRPPRFPDLFEAFANAVANQQLSLEVGLTLLNRLAAAFGTPAPGGEGLIAFPQPEAIATASPAELRELGFSAAKADYLQGLADAVAIGRIDECTLAHSSRAEATKRLLALRGIGRWSAEYVLLRGLGRLEVYPGDDVGARNKLRRFLGLDHDPGYEEIAERLRPLRPFTGVLYFHLLLDGLAERGDLNVAVAASGEP